MSTDHNTNVIFIDAQINFRFIETIGNSVAGIFDKTLTIFVVVFCKIKFFFISEEDIFDCRDK